MHNQPDLKIIGGTDVYGRSVAASESTGTFTGVVDADGTPYFKGRPPTPPTPPPHSNSDGGDRGDPMSEIAGLKKNVGFLNWAVGLIFISGLAAIITSFLVIDDRINDRFNRADDRAQRIEQQLQDVRVMQVQQGADVKAILEKLNVDKPQPSEKRKSDR